MESKINNTLETLEILENGNINSKINKKKQPTQLLKWCFTWNNYIEDEIETLETVFQSVCKKYVFQKEIGEKNGVPHLQGSIWLKKKMRWSEFDLNNKIIWSKMRNEIASAKYCQKSSTSVGEPYLWGFPKPIRTIEVLRPWQADVEKITLGTPDERTVYWFWEAEGNIGKSAFTKYMVVKHNALFCSGGKVADIMNLVFNQDMERTETVIFDIPRANHGNISYASLEAIKNGLVCNTKYETGSKVFNPPHVIVFANYPPEDEEKLSSDRWHVREIRGDKLVDKNVPYELPMRAKLRVEIPDIFREKSW